MEAALALAGVPVRGPDVAFVGKAAIHDGRNMIIRARTRLSQRSRDYSTAVVYSVPLCMHTKYSRMSCDKERKATRGFQI